MDEQIERRLVEDSMRQIFESTLPMRIERYLKARPHGIVPATEFAPVSGECSELFRDGRFYGCIALAQAVAEAIVRFLCEKNGWHPQKVFEKNVERLNMRKFISKELKDKFLMLWERRDDYHHLNSSIEQHYGRLQDIAFEKIRLLSEIESELFAFSVKDGKLVPRNPKYWNIKADGLTPVFLKLE